MKSIPLNERIILALDFADPTLARPWVERRDNNDLKFFKVGLRLFLAGGWPVVEHMVRHQPADIVAGFAGA